MYSVKIGQEYLGKDIHIVLGPIMNLGKVTRGSQN